MVRQISRTCQMTVSYRSVASPGLYHYISTIACKTIVLALVMSHLDDGNAVICRVPDSHLQKHQMVQNSAARLITGNRNREHITPILVTSHWPLIRQRIGFKLLLLIYFAVHLLPRLYISTLITPYTRSADQSLLIVP